MSSNEDLDPEERSFWNLLRRRRPGFHAFCALFDLLGVTSLLRREQYSEVQARLDDLQQGFGYAFDLYPLEPDYKVCLAGDSLVIVQEIDPDRDWQEAWPTFAGHLGAIAATLHRMDREIGNPGLRATIAFGQLLQVTEPESWGRPGVIPSAASWVVLSGAAEALVKCFDVEKVGSAGGFPGRFLWIEDPAERRTFRGVPLDGQRVETPWESELSGAAHYSKAYATLTATATRRSALQSPDSFTGGRRTRTRRGDRL